MEIVHFEHKLSWLCFDVPQKASYQLREYSLGLPQKASYQWRLSNLSISSHDFALGFPKDLMLMERVFFVL